MHRSAPLVAVPPPHSEADQIEVHFDRLDSGLWDVELTILDSGVAVAGIGCTVSRDSLQRLADDINARLAVAA